MKIKVGGINYSINQVPYVDIGDEEETSKIRVIEEGESIYDYDVHMAEYLGYRPPCLMESYEDYAGYVESMVLER